MMDLLLAAVIATSPQDRAGRFTFEVAFDAQAIYLAEGYRVWDHALPVPAGTVCEVRSFIGWDAGSVGEANLELNLAGQRLYERSPHKEAPINYEAWELRAAFIEFERGDLLHVHTGASMTAPRTVDGGLSTRIQFAFRLRMSASRRCDAPARH